jgi:hypothetical protein
MQSERLRHDGRDGIAFPVRPDIEDDRGRVPFHANDFTPDAVRMPLALVRGRRYVR